MSPNLSLLRAATGSVSAGTSSAKSFIYRFYAEWLANPFIYRIYAKHTGWGAFQSSFPGAQAGRPLRLCGKPLAFIGLRALVFSFRFFLYRLPLFSGTCGLFCKNTRVRLPQRQFGVLPAHPRRALTSAQPPVDICEFMVWIGLGELLLSMG